MELTRQKFIELFGNPALWATNGLNGFVHYEALPNTTDMYIGYCVNKTSENSYNLAAFMQKDTFCDFLTVIEVEDNGASLTIAAVYENGEKIDMMNTDVVNRAVGKMALQFDYISTLSQQKQPKSRKQAFAF